MRVFVPTGMSWYVCLLRSKWPAVCIPPETFSGLLTRPWVLTWDVHNEAMLASRFAQLYIFFISSGTGTVLLVAVFERGGRRLVTSGQFFVLVSLCGTLGSISICWATRLWPWRRYRPPPPPILSLCIGVSLSLPLPVSVLVPAPDHPAAAPSLTLPFISARSFFPAYTTCVGHPCFLLIGSFIRR